MIGFSERRRRPASIGQRRAIFVSGRCRTRHRFDSSAPNPNFHSLTESPLSRRFEPPGRVYSLVHSLTVNFAVAVLVIEPDTPVNVMV
jgi:hypothetical protein